MNKLFIWRALNNWLNIKKNLTWQWLYTFNIFFVVVEDVIFISIKWLLSSSSSSIDLMKTMKWIHTWLYQLYVCLFVCLLVFNGLISFTSITFGTHTHTYTNINTWIQLTMLLSFSLYSSFENNIWDMLAFVCWSSIE
mgnify:FL=1